jgi:hypothetical protein
MHFKVKTKDADLTISAHDLFVQILNQAFEDFNSEDNINTDFFIEEINKILLATDNVLLDSSNKQIYSIYFLAGYYYKIFMNKNNVTVEKE